MAHVKKKVDHQLVDIAVGAVSYISLTNADNDFSGSTQVLTVQDTVHAYAWDAVVVKETPGEIRVRLTTQARSAAKHKSGKKVTDSTPDGGSLTITITSPIKPVDPVPVDYVNDTPP